ncbi:hypothetical protein [Cellulomonas timonensis]|nr:hypothetical protein [Cellulomonas timonensis]
MSALGQRRASLGARQRLIAGMLDPRRDDKEVVRRPPTEEGRHAGLDR